MGRTVLQLVAAILILQVPSSVTASQASLTSSVSTVHEGFTKELTLNCSLPYSPTSGFSALISLIVSKTATPKDSIYTEIASITQFSPDTVAVKNTSFGSHAIGQLVANQDAFLTLQWSYPVKAVQGRYKCEAFGVDKGGHPVSALASVIINEGPVDLSMMLSQLAQMDQAQDKRQALRNEQVSNLTKAITHQNQELDALDNAKTTLAMLISDLSSDNSVLESLAAEYSRELDILKLGIHSTKALFHESTQRQGHSYLISNFTLGTIDLIKADSLCFVHGGYLAEIRTRAEYDFIVEFIKKYVLLNANHYVMLGATDNRQEGAWQYVTSEQSVTYFDWGPSSLQENVGYASQYDCQFLQPQRATYNDEYEWKMYNYACVANTNYNMYLLCEIEH